MFLLKGYYQMEALQDQCIYKLLKYWKKMSFFSQFQCIKIMYIENMYILY